MWWPDFLRACGLHQKAPMSSLLPPESFNADLGQQWIEFLNETLISFGPRREAFLVRRARCLDDVWTAMSSAARELGLSVSTMVPRPPQFLLEGPSGHSMEVPTHVESSEACAGFVPKTTGSPGGATPTEQLLSSLLSKDQNVEPLPPVSEARGGHSREDDVDDWDYELDVTDIPILNPNWDPSMENPEDPNFSIPFDDLMKMIVEPLPTTNQRAVQDTVVAFEPITIGTTPSLPAEATSDQGNPLSVSTSIALNEEKSEPPTPSHPLLDPYVPHEETGIPTKPLSQPFDPAVIIQDDLSPVLDPGDTNNNGGDSFVPMPLASDLPVTVKKVEVAIKPSEHLSDVENSEVTSPLTASKPDSSETYVVSGDHNLDRSPQALEVLEARLAVL
ncbi:hypothetical protein Taro_029439 [Colocasia esculenta]|uniref:Uncharacterized protein n=1 Tax=Colocasia esculenta TaxID=4460 RepID=A0A843VX60_COLES|nr:hypothetical protein [Colocasia esculenta]